MFMTASHFSILLSLILSITSCFSSGYAAGHSTEIRNTNKNIIKAAEASLSTKGIYKLIFHVNDCLEVEPDIKEEIDTFVSEILFLSFPKVLSLAASPNVTCISENWSLNLLYPRAPPYFL
ncbi:MAG: hypothetical protein ACOH5I_06860 [Oligoflexus sp.]